MLHARFQSGYSVVLFAGFMCCWVVCSLFRVVRFEKIFSDPNFPVLAGKILSVLTAVKLFTDPDFGAAFDGLRVQHEPESSHSAALLLLSCGACVSTEATRISMRASA
jgi:hypothetical protein